MNSKCFFKNAEVLSYNFNRFLSSLPSHIVENLPINHAEIISNYANPAGFAYETLSSEFKDKICVAIENRVNDSPIQVFSYFPICLSRCEGCRYQIRTLREIEQGLDSSSEQYINDQLLFASSIAKSTKGNKSINNLYEGGGTATIQSVEQLRKKWLEIREIFGFEKIGSVTIEGNPIHFCKEDYVSNLILTAQEIFGKGWEIRFSIGGFGFDIDGRTESGSSLPRAIRSVNKVSQKLGIEVNINVDTVYGSNDSSLETHLARIKTILDLGVRNLTLYGWEKSPDNQKNLYEYIEEYFGILDFIQEYADINNLEVLRSPSSLGGDWISLTESRQPKQIEYLNGRWNISQDLIGLTGYSLLEIKIAEKIYFVRATTPQLPEDVKKLAGSIRKGEVELGLTKEGLKGFGKVEIYNSNLKALNLLHYSGRLYKKYRL